MPTVSLHFNVHQPNRLKPYTFFEIGKDHFYEDDDFNRDVLNRVAENCYLPANKLMQELLEKHNGKFRLAMTLSGVFIEQLESHRPDVLESFKSLIATGHVDLYATTYYHSLAYVYSKDEFDRQVALHMAKIKEHFGITPTVFRNTELIHYNELAAHVESLGFEAIMSDDVSWVLNGRSSNVLYKAPNAEKIKIALMNSKLSGDISFRFKDSSWEQYPLTADKYTDWLANCEGDNVNLMMDYETIGEFHKAGSGIFPFMENMIDLCVERGVEFKTIGQVVKEQEVKGTLDVHYPVSGADSERDLSAWNGNAMQDEAISKVYGMEELVKSFDDEDLTHVWAKLQTSDHFFYLSTKAFGDGEVHQAKSPYSSPYDGYIYFMNALSDLEITIEKRAKARLAAESRDTMVKDIPGVPSAKRSKKAKPSKKVKA